MNLNAYDDINELDKTRPWYSVSFNRLYIKGIKARAYYTIVKRFESKEYVYYLVASDDVHIPNPRNLTKDNYGRYKINVPRNVVAETSLAGLSKDSNINVALVDRQEDGEVYRIDI